MLPASFELEKVSSFHIRITHRLFPGWKQIIAYQLPVSPVFPCPPGVSTWTGGTWAKTSGKPIIVSINFIMAKTHIQWLSIRTALLPFHVTGPVLPEQLYRVPLWPVNELLQNYERLQQCRRLGRVKIYRRDTLKIVPHGSEVQSCSFLFFFFFLFWSWECWHSRVKRHVRCPRS